MTGSASGNTTVQLPIDRILLQINDQAVRQIHLKQDICRRILADYQRQGKSAQLIAGNGQVCMTRIMSADEAQVGIFVPDSIKVRFNDHILLVLYNASEKYVIQGFVKRLMLPKVVLAFADPRMQKRWRMRLSDPVLQTCVPEKVTQALCQLELKMVRQVVTENEKGILSVREMICSDVQQQSAIPNEEYSSDEVNFQEEKKIMQYISEQKTQGFLYDLSSSGAAIVPQKNDKSGEPGKLIFMQFPALTTHLSHTSVRVFEMALFGIIRYRRPFKSGRQDIFGVKFIQPIVTEHFLEIVERISIS